MGCAACLCVAQPSLQPEAGSSVGDAPQVIYSAGDQDPETKW